MTNVCVYITVPNSRFLALYCLFFLILLELIMLCDYVTRGYDDHPPRLLLVRANIGGCVCVFITGEGESQRGLFFDCGRVLLAQARARS